MSSHPALSLRSISTHWDEFFFHKTELSIVGPIRIAYGLLLLIWLAVLGLDLELWFSETGYLPLAAHRQIVDPDALSFLAFLPQTPVALWVCYICFIFNAICLLLGFYSRVQAIFVFFWMVSFQHRNILVFDGEDTVFRLFAFYLIFLPCGDYLSLDRLRFRNLPNSDLKFDVWPLRLMQLQMSFIYLCTGWQKLRSDDWLDGYALYYISRLDDLFCRFPLPSWIFNSLDLLGFTSMLIPFFEIFLAIGLWLKPTRRFCIAAGILFHLTLDYSMNLFLFEWIMILGLMSFLDYPSVLTYFRKIPIRLRPAKNLS